MLDRIGGRADPLSALIGEIYDAALDQDLWPSVLGATARFVGGSAASLFWKDVAAKSGGVLHDDGGLDGYYKQLYFEKYVQFDPSTNTQVFAAVGQPITTVDWTDYDEFLKTRFFHEWSRPQKLVDFVCVALDKSATRATMLGIFREERHGLVDDETRRRVRQIVPHIRRAMLVAKAIDQKTAEAATFADALDGLRAALLLVDGRGRIVHANAAGQGLLAAGDVLRLVGSRLAGTEGQTDNTLGEILRAVGNGDPGIGAKGIALPLTGRDGARHVAHVLPLASGARHRIGATHGAVAAIFVHKATITTRSPPEAIAKSYKLTPTELRVLLAIVDVGGVPEVAEALGVADTTVKTHLGRVYGKTGTGRQADLVKLVAGFSHPLLN